MMHADLIDQEDLVGQLRALGFQTPSGVSAEQACEHAVRGLDAPQAKALKGMVEQMYTCLLYTSPSPRDLSTSRMPSSA